MIDYHKQFEEEFKPEVHWYAKEDETRAIILQEFIDQWWVKAFKPGILSFIDKVVEEAKEEGKKETWREAMDSGSDAVGKIVPFIRQEAIKEVIDELNNTDFILDTNAGKYALIQQLKEKYGIK